jgi:hypothetical protein
MGPDVVSHDPSAIQLGHQLLRIQKSLKYLSKPVVLVCSWEKSDTISVESEAAPVHTQGQNRANFGH